MLLVYDFLYRYFYPHSTLCEEATLLLHYNYSLHLHYALDLSKDNRCIVPALLHEATLCSVAAPTYHLPVPQWDEIIFEVVLLYFTFGNLSKLKKYVYCMPSK